MTTLTLIRHAEPQAWVDQLVAGPVGCTGLSDRGRRQAAALRDRLLTSDFTTDVVLTSILPRAIETAEIIAPAVGGLEAIQDCDYCELHPGDADGMSWTDYLEAYGVIPHETPDQPFAPGGETLVAFEARVHAALTDIVAHYPDEQVTIVTHGGFISAVCLELLGARVSVPRGFVLAPSLTSLTIWVESEERPGLWELERYNDTAHLELLV